VDNVRAKLSPALRPILDLEIGLGNEVDWIEEPSGTRCPYAVVFKRPLHFRVIRVNLERLTFWENDDPHYALHVGILCEQTRHCVEGPRPVGILRQVWRWITLRPMK
jgi:hypothetical protein